MSARSFTNSPWYQSTCGFPVFLGKLMIRTKGVFNWRVQ
jgi:hypothetical protein